MYRPKQDDSKNKGKNWKKFRSNESDGWLKEDKKCGNSPYFTYSTQIARSIRKKWRVLKKKF
jgi:hypothetical protein